MTFRTPNPYSNTQGTLDIQRLKERMAILSQQITTGKRIVRPGDDPTGAALIMDFRNSISRNQSYMNQMDSAATFLKATEASLTGISDSLTRLMEIGTQALGATTDSARAAIAPEVNGILTNMLALANKQDQGKYIFAGTKTDTQPFGAPSVNPTTYSGDSNSISVDVSLGASVTTNLTGDAVFIGNSAPNTDLFQQVSIFAQALGPPSNVAQMQTAFNNIETIFSGIQSQLTVVGGREASLIQMKSSMEEYNASLQAIQESYEAVDYPRALTDYESANTTQQAALRILAKSNAQNLFNFLT